MSLYLEGMLTIYTLLIPKNQWRHFSEIPCGIFLRDAKNHPLVETEASPLKFSNSNDFILTYSFQRLPSTLFSSKGFHRIWIWFKCLWPLGMQFAAFSLKIENTLGGLPKEIYTNPPTFSSDLAPFLCPNGRLRITFSISKSGVLILMEKEAVHYGLGTASQGWSPLTLNRIISYILRRVDSA